METDVERYTWLVAYELSEARLASTEGLKDYHLEWARRFAVTRDVKRAAWALSKIKWSRRLRQ